jgi:hypothetical protein
MRVAVVIVFVSILATASEASPSCETRTEARRHYGSAHLYWHGADHCWTATAAAGRHHRIHHVREKSTHHVREQADQQDREKADRQARPKADHQAAEPKIDHPKWHESMSQMLPGDEEPVRTSWVERWVDIEPAQSPLGARWVDIVQAAPADIMAAESEPMITPRSVMMVITVLTLTLAIVEFLIIGMRLAGPPWRWL